MKAATSRRQFEPDDLLNDEDLANYLGITPQHARCARMKKPTWDGPPWIEISPKVKRWLFSDVLEWANERRRRPIDRTAV